MISRHRQLIPEIIVNISILLFAPVILASYSKAVSTNVIVLFPLVIICILYCVFRYDIKQLKSKSMIYSGLLVGLVLSLASRIGVVIEYFILSESKDLFVLPKIIFTHWIAHIGFAFLCVLFLYIKLYLVKRGN